MDTQQTVTSKTGVQKIGTQVSDLLPKVKNEDFNLRDRLNDMLLIEKHNLTSYQIAINEMINDDLRQIVIDNRNNTQDIQIRFFNELFNLGEYQADTAIPAQITDTFDVFNNYKTQFPIKQ